MKFDPLEQQGTDNTTPIKPLVTQREVREKEKTGCMICSQGNTMCDKCKENIKGFVGSREEKKVIYLENMCGLTENGEVLVMLTEDGKTTGPFEATVHPLPIKEEK